MGSSNKVRTVRLLCVGGIGERGKVVGPHLEVVDLLGGGGGYFVK